MFIYLLIVLIIFIITVGFIIFTHCSLLRTVSRTKSKGKSTTIVTVFKILRFEHEIEYEDKF